MAQAPSPQVTPADPEAPTVVIDQPTMTMKGGSPSYTAAEASVPLTIKAHAASGVAITVMQIMVNGQVVKTCSVASCAVEIYGGRYISPNVDEDLITISVTAEDKNAKIGKSTVQAKVFRSRGQTE